jgi:hypothetical protein
MSRRAFHGESVREGGETAACSGTNQVDKEKAPGIDARRLLPTAADMQPDGSDYWLF